MSIIGAKRLIPALRHERSGRPDLANPYQRRDWRLKGIGFESYKEYLKSDEWKRIRTRVLSNKPLCALCDSVASELHHVKYHIYVLLGMGDEWLLPLCRKHHHQIEFSDDGKKLKMSQANTKLFPMLRACERGKEWLENYYAACGRTRGLPRE